MTRDRLHLSEECPIFKEKSLCDIRFRNDKKTIGEIVSRSPKSPDMISAIKRKETWDLKTQGHYRFLRFRDGGFWQQEGPESWGFH